MAGSSGWKADPPFFAFPGPQIKGESGLVLPDFPPPGPFLGRGRRDFLASLPIAGQAHLAADGIDVPAAQVSQLIRVLFMAALQAPEIGLRAGAIVGAALPGMADHI